MAVIDALIQSLLLDLHAHPEAFDAAPTADQGAATEHRRLYETHACKACGDHAGVAYIAESRVHPGATPRWVDLCLEHARRLRIEVERIELDPEALAGAIQAAERS